jgi:hypothetical protein
MWILTNKMIKNFIFKIYNKFKRIAIETADYLLSTYYSFRRIETSKSKKYLMVGSESSGTTAISNLLFSNISGLRFLEEGEQQWAWGVYQNVYQNKAQVKDFSRLHLFDAIKVPGFATIISEFREFFPNTTVIYIVRDPRDFVNSAIKTWKVNNTSELKDIPWVTENWLSISNNDPIERLALRWQTYLTRAQQQKNVIFVKYEDFCKDKVKTIGELAKEVNLPFNEQRVTKLCESQLSHKSVRAYKPTGPGGWRDGKLTDEEIQRIERICSTEMKEWGYRASVDMDS